MSLIKDRPYSSLRSDFAHLSQIAKLTKGMNLANPLIRRPNTGMHDSKMVIERGTSRDVSGKPTKEEIR